MLANDGLTIPIFNWLAILTKQHKIFIVIAHVNDK